MTGAREGVEPTGESVEMLEECLFFFTRVATLFPLVNNSLGTELAIAPDSG